MIQPRTKYSKQFEANFFSSSLLKMPQKRSWRSSIHWQISSLNLVQTSIDLLLVQKTHLALPLLFLKSHCYMQYLRKITMVQKQLCSPFQLCFLVMENYALWFDNWYYSWLPSTECYLQHLERWQVCVIPKIWRKYPMKLKPESQETI